MSVFQSIILGIVQGLTEFLPVSSSGHLVVFQDLLGLVSHSLAFDIAVHIGTLLSILTIYRTLVWRLLKGVVAVGKTRKWTAESRLVFLVIIGSIPTAIIGFGLKDTFEQLFNSLQAVAIFFLVTGGLLFATRFAKSDPGPSLQSSKNVNLDSVFEISIFKALVIGFSQGLAIAPGISRAGTTIAAGMLLGLPRNLAAMFSFILSIPAILGAGLLEFKDVSWTPEVVLPMCVGLITAYLFGLIGLWAVLKVVRQGRLEVFCIYLWILGISLLLFRV